jgi:nicotinamide mononucleotide adenylyltransferase
LYHVTDFDYQINQKLGGIFTADHSSQRPAKIMLLAGADLIGTMSTPGVWDEKDLDHILGDFGAIIIERSGIEMKEALVNLEPWEDNIIVVPQLIANDVSSTKLRLFLKRHMSVKWMTPHSVVKYMKEKGLYVDDADAQSKEKQKSTN